MIRIKVRRLVRGLRGRFRIRPAPHAHGWGWVIYADGEPVEWFRKLVDAVRGLEEGP